MRQVAPSLIRRSTNISRDPNVPHPDQGIHEELLKWGIPEQVEGIAIHVLQHLD